MAESFTEVCKSQLKRLSTQRIVVSIFVLVERETAGYQRPQKIFFPENGKCSRVRVQRIYAAMQPRPEARIPIGTGARVTDVNGERGGEFKIRE